MGGGTIRLSAIGPQDFHLTANPQITHFKSVFKRHTNFSKETKRIFFLGEDSPSFGSKDLKAVVRNEGDLLGNVYLEVNITATTSSNSYTVTNFANSLFLITFTASSRECNLIPSKLSYNFFNLLLTFIINSPRPLYP